MTLPEAITILEDHQEWRLGIVEDAEPANPKKLTEALEIAINLLTQIRIEDEDKEETELPWKDIK